MGTVTYAYEPEQAVWVITGGKCPASVREGIVTYIRINITSMGSPTSTEILYNVKLTGDNGTTEFLEADVFATLTDASTEYELRLTPPGSP